MRSPHASATLAKLAVLSALVLSLSTPSVSRAWDYDPDHPSFRFGISGAGGGFAGTVTGLYGGVQLRLGVQWTEQFATYVMGQGLIGSFVPTAAGASVVGFALNTLMFEGSAGRHFQFGGGPSLDFLWGCDGNPVNSHCGTSSVFFGLDGRLALHFSPLTISFDVHPMWFRSDSASVLLMLGIGVDFD